MQILNLTQLSDISPISPSPGKSSLSAPCLPPPPPADTPPHTSICLLCIQGRPSQAAQAGHSAVTQAWDISILLPQSSTSTSSLIFYVKI